MMNTENKNRLEKIAKIEKIALTWYLHDKIIAEYNLEMMSDDEIVKAIKSAKRKAEYEY